MEIHFKNQSFSDYDTKIIIEIILIVVIGRFLELLCLIREIKVC